MRPAGRAGSPDVIVVGAGPAGAVVARRLAEDGAGVLVVEAGADTRGLGRGPAHSLPLSEQDLRARSIAASGRPGEHVHLWRGRGPGGSGAINGAVWAPAPRSVTAKWSGFGVERYEAAVARAEAVMRPMEVPTSPLAAELAGTLGVEPIPGRLTIDANGLRRDPWTSYDPEVAGALLRCDARVHSLSLARTAGGSTYVEGVMLDDGARLDAEVVVLAAGAIDSARLLQRAAADPQFPADLALTQKLRSAGGDAREHPEVLLDLPFQLRELLAEAPAGILGARIPLDIGGRRVEVRPYEVPFHMAIPGLPKSPPQVGIALLDPRSASVVSPGDVHLTAHPDASDEETLRAAATLVHDALSSLAGGAIDSGRTVHAARGYSQHLYATAPIGTITTSSGTIDGLSGLRVADGSLLPAGLGTGPYASVFAVAEAVAADMLAR